MPLPRFLPGVSFRVETGPICFGDDWPGLFVRGDNAFNYALHLQLLVEAMEKQDPLFNPIVMSVVKGLLKDLQATRI